MSISRGKHHQILGASGNPLFWNGPFEGSGKNVLRSIGFRGSIGTAVFCHIHQPPSMGLAYLPPHVVDLYDRFVGKYTIHGYKKGHIMLLQSLLSTLDKWFNYVFFSLARNAMDENGSFRHHLVASFNMFQSMGLNSKEQKIMIPMFQNKRYKNISRLQHEQYSFETTNLPGNSRHLVAPTPPIPKKNTKITQHRRNTTRRISFVEPKFWGGFILGPPPEIKTHHCDRPVAPWGFMLVGYIVKRDPYFMGLWNNPDITGSLFHGLMKKYWYNGILISWAYEIILIELVIKTQDPYFMAIEIIEHG